jgi:lipoprotein-releasing system permease protein
MNLSLYIAKRYLFAKKSHHVINIISMVSMVGVAVGTFGLIVVLSVFNGFGNLVVSLYDEFDPDVKITVKEGKTFDPDYAGITSLKKLPGLKIVAEVMEENALIKYRDKQFIGRIKGMSDEYGKASGIKNKILDGSFILRSDSVNFAVFGSMVAYSLGINLSDPFYPVMIYLPRKGESVTLNPMEAFASSAIHPSGVFAIQQDFDSKYVLVPLQLARELTEEQKKVTALEILYKPGVNKEEVLKQISTICGPAFNVKDRVAQHDFLFKILKSEKLAVFMILGLILLIATFSIIGSLTMLIIEKKKDMAILNSMGANQGMISRIFLAEGMMITSIGAFSGLMLGWITCYLQKNYGLIRLENGESFVVESYPVAMQPGDFLMVLILVTGIGLLASIYTSRKLVKRQLMATEKI